MQMPIKQAVDLGYRQNGIAMVNLKFAPSWTRRCVRDKANLIARQICYVATQIFRCEREPFNLLRLRCPGLGDEFDLSWLVRRHTPNVVCGRLAILNLKMQLRRLIPLAQ